MDRIKKSTEELQFLRMLCDEFVATEDRLELLRSLQGHVFEEPEHQVVFESICSLFVRGPISAARLSIHLNNRGFPDIDMDMYCPAQITNCPRNEGANEKDS